MKNVNTVLKNEVMEFGSIYKTNNYSMFKSIGSNRKLNPLNYGKLLRSMGEEQLIIPICVNEKYEVIDGQHRLRACEELGLSVYYYVLDGYSVEQMKRANLVSANWKKDDFLNAYTNEGQGAYLEFADMKIRYGLNTSDLLKIIARLQYRSVATTGVEFEEGKLSIKDEEVDMLNNFLTALEDFSFFIDYKRSKFVSAFLELYFFNGYNHEQMVARLQTRKSALEVQITKDDYIKILTNKIYSFGATKRNIYYDIDRKRLYTLN